MANRNIFLNFCKHIITGNFRYIIFRFIKFNKLHHPDISNTFYEMATSTKIRIAIYTVIFGSYDDLHEPTYLSPQCDYYIVTDQKVPDGSAWKRIPLDSFQEQIKGFSNQERSRFFKLHPHLLFPNYEYTVFVDGCIQIVADMRPIVTMIDDHIIGIHLHPYRDCIYQEAFAVVATKKANKKTVKRQIRSYRAQGFPRHYGLFETNVVVRKHNDPDCIKLMEDWWGEMVRYTMRDQLSFTYCLWKNGWTSDYVKSLGPATSLNPRFYCYQHKQG